MAEFIILLSYKEMIRLYLLWYFDLKERRISPHPWKKNKKKENRLNNGLN